MTRNAVKFVRDFLFTDVYNHLEFLKWTESLGKDDGILLAYLLERMSSPEPLKALDPIYVQGEKVSSYRAQQKSIRNFPIHGGNTKNPLHIAKVHAALLSLRDHQDNIYDCAFLLAAKRFWCIGHSPLLRVKEFYWWTVMAFVAFFSQWCFFAFLVYSEVSDEYNDKESFVPANWEAEDVLIMIIALLSTIYFAHLLFPHLYGVFNFRRTVSLVFEENRKHAYFPFVLLWMNFSVNVVLSVLAVAFNMFFVLRSESVSDAILNCIAIYFIIEVDDLMKPDWDNDHVEDERAELFLNYIMSPDVGDLHVEKIAGPGCYLETDKLYVDVDYAEPMERRKDGERVVVVYKSDTNEDENDNLSTRYIPTVYVLKGSESKEFHAALSQFKCAWALEDVRNSRVFPIASLCCYVCPCLYRTSYLNSKIAAS